MVQVTTLTDTVNPNDGVISLREAISNAVNGDTITFANGLSGGTINIGSQLNINKSITINGDITGNQQTTDITINGQNNSRIFNIDDGNNSSFSNVVISGLKLINGKVTGFTSSGSGGGIFNRKFESKQQ
jgi:CSLREA domain-containing protein